MVFGTPSVEDEVDEDGDDGEEGAEGTEGEVGEGAEDGLHLVSRRVDWKERPLVCWLGQLE